MIRFFTIICTIGTVLSLCPNVTFYENGIVSITQTLYNCMALANDPSLVISYSGYPPNITVYNQISLNNLVVIDEIEGTLTIDIIFRNTWKDERWNIPDLFKNLDPSLASNGIEMRDLINANEDNLRLWLPTDLTFQNVLEQTVDVETIKLMPAGTIFWSRHMLLKLSQSGFDYHDYPLDRQEILMTFESYGTPATYLMMGLQNPPIRYSTNADGELAFLQNPMWSHTAGDFSAEIIDNNYIVDVNGVESPRFYQKGVFRIYIERQSEGVLIRLGLPVLLLIVIAGLSFWADASTRVATTMTLLLAVSALYIVVFSTIPLLGYLTAFDSYIIEMFILLTLCLAIHQLVELCESKGDRYPSRLAIARILVFLGRISIIPLAVILFWVEFGEDWSLKLQVSTVISIFTLVALITLRDGKGIRNVVVSVADHMKYKMDSPQEFNPTIYEILLFNVLIYGKFSISMRYHSKAQEKIQARVNSRGVIELKNLDEKSAAGKATLNVLQAENASDSDDEEEETKNSRRNAKVDFSQVL